MKTLSVLRHAKAAWADRGTRDFDRPLDVRGGDDARALGTEMHRLGLRFDAVVASPALRVTETLDGVGTGYGEAVAADFDPQIYLAPLAVLTEIVHETEDGVARLLIAGHNPGCALLAQLLVGGGDKGLRTRLDEGFPTGTLAEIELPVANWADAAPGIGRLTRFIRPRDLAGG
jgi:phosphohistidine phosphatase